MAVTVQQLVKDNCGDGKVRQYKVIAEDGGTLETAGIVLWHNDREWGTHRFVINAEQDEGMLVWGHYHRGPHGAVDAYKDYLARIAEDI